ncbi:MAG: hypothetical protein WBN40_02415, partial [Pseudomonadales bacterium]
GTEARLFTTHADADVNASKGLAQILPLMLAAYLYFMMLWRMGDYSGIEEQFQTRKKRWGGLLRRCVGKCTTINKQDY